jgi:light-regulated signal transduction histidine kinase (bacteriophytochrome)
MVPMNQDQLLHRITHRIRQSLELQDILNTTTAEVQQFLKVDRVKIYKFHPDRSGHVIAEHLAADQPLPSLCGLNFPATDIPPETCQLFIEARVRTVTNVQAGVIGQSRLRNPETGERISEDLAFRSLDPCHQQYLTTMGVQSTLVAPIFHHDDLWGLLVTHHSQPNDIPIDELQGIQFVVDQLSVAIAQSSLLQQSREQAQRNATLHHLSSLLHVRPTLELQPVLDSTIEALNGSGGRLLIQLPDRTPQVYTHGAQPILQSQGQFTLMEQYDGIQAHFQNPNPHPWAIDDLYQVDQLEPLYEAFRPTKIRSLLIIPLITRQQVIGYLSLFRDEFETERLWAGAQDLDHRQDGPRQSFDLWRQSQTGQIHPWSAQDLELVQDLAHQLASKIEQHELYQQIQALNTNLEAQVQSRTIELEQMLTALQHTQSQLIQTEKMSSLGQLVAGVAHEINNPVTFIHGNIAHVSDYMQALLRLVNLYQSRYGTADLTIQSLIQEIDLDFLTEDLHKVLSSMQIGTHRIREIVLSLRNFSRLDQAAKKPVNIHEGIDSTLLILQHRLKSVGNHHEIQIIKHYGDLPEVECYASQLNQVLMNILANAIDALDEQQQQPKLALPHRPSVITITTETIAANAIKITIEDNGSGIPGLALPKLFDPFYTTKPVGQGTGLGLAISYQIITEKHQGKLQCFSTPGTGSQFVIELPLA